MHGGSLTTSQGTIMAQNTALSADVRTAEVLTLAQLTQALSQARRVAWADPQLPSAREQVEEVAWAMSPSKAKK